MIPEDSSCNSLSPFKFKLLVLKYSSATWWRYMVIKMLSVVGKSYFCFLNGEGGNSLSKYKSSTFSHMAVNVVLEHISTCFTGVHPSFTKSSTFTGVLGMTKTTVFFLQNP